MGYLLRTETWAFLLTAVAISGFSCRSKLDVKTTGSSKTAATCSPGLGGEKAADPSAAAAAAAACGPVDEPTDTATETAKEPEPKEEEKPEEVVEETPPVPVEMENMLALLGPKTHFQTRDVITIRIPAEMIDGGDHYRILNVSKEEEGGEPLVLLDEAIDADTQALRSAHYKSKRMALVKQGGDYVFAFYPGGGWEGRFFYGVNKLRLEVDDVENPRFANLQLTLRDFEVFGMAMASFANNVQVATGPGWQFQGWVNVLSPPTVEVKNEANGVVAKLTHGLFNIVNPH
jgi:hypothetical protein